MKKLLLIGMLSGLAVFARADEGQLSGESLGFEARTYTNGTNVLHYQIYVPDNPESGEKVPLILCLHGAGERGSDNHKQLKYGVKNILACSRRNHQPVIVVAPQCPVGRRWVEVDWSADAHRMPRTPSVPMQMVQQLLQETLQQLPVDPRRVYVTGLSMGGFGTWDIIQRNPALFAAAVPVCGGGDPAYADRLADLPIWVFHGDADGTVKVERSREMVAALKEAGGHPLYTEYPGVGHGSWGPAYNNPDLWTWMFSQQKTEPGLEQ